jgi:hypothetical protein
VSKAALTLLALLALAGCRNPETKRDYDAVRERSERQHQGLDAYDKQ